MNLSQLIQQLNPAPRSAVLRPPLMIVLIIGLCTLLFGLYLWGPNLGAKWWIIDDHEIMYYLGEDGKMSFSEIPARLGETEVGAWGKYLRCRPAYYFLRLLETWMWEGGIFWWYLTRFLIFCFWMSALWWLVHRKIGLGWSGIFIFLVFGLPYWGDIFARLGPSEVYTVLGLALYLLGWTDYFAKLSQPMPSVPEGLTDHLLMGLGALIAIGSKENFILILLPALALGGYALYRKKMTWVLTLTTLLIVAYGIFIALGIVIAISHTGKDIYSHDATPAGRFAILIQGWPKLLTAFHITWWNIILVGGGMIGIGLFLFLSKGWLILKKQIKIISKYLLIASGLLLLYWSQMVFYHGDWPLQNRYAFPGLLAISFFWLLALIALFEMLELLEINRYISLSLKVCSVLFFLVIIQFPRDATEWKMSYLAEKVKTSALGKIDTALWEYEPLKTYAYLRKMSLDNREKTIYYTQLIEQISAECKKQPTAPLVFESFDALDYEPIASVRLFLLARKVRNPMYLRINGYSIASGKPGSDKSLAETLIRVSRNGGRGDHNQWGFAPLGTLKTQESKCILVEFLKDRPSEAKKYRITNYN